MGILFENCDLLLRGEDGVYSTLHGFLGVRGDTIDYIGTEKPTGEYEEHKSMEHKLLMPGLINCHNHSPMVLLRGVGSGLPLREWLFDKVFPIEDRLVPEDIAAGSRLAILEMLASGTTSFSDMYFFPAETVAAVAEAGMKANISRCVQCFDENQTVGQNTQIPQSVELFEKYHNAENGRIRIDFSVHAEYTCKPHIVRAYSELCKAHGGRMHIHLSETREETELCLKNHGKRPVALCRDLGLLDLPCTLAHVVDATEEELDILAEYKAVVAHNPSSNMKLASGVAPVPAMLERGLAVGLGTDGPASNNQLNMFTEMGRAALLHKLAGHDPTLLPATRVLDMATLGGAAALHDARLGSLAPGKAADCVALDLASPNLQPLYNVVSQTVYAATGLETRLTMVGGEILYQDGRFSRFDYDALCREMRDLRAFVLRAAGLA